MRNVKTTQSFTFDVDVWKEFVELTTENGIKRSFIVNSIVKKWVEESLKVKDNYSDNQPNVKKC